MTVTLPKAYQVDQRHLFNICSRSQLEAERCRGRQPMGTVSVKTPLLDRAPDGPGLCRLGLRQAAAPGLHPRRPGHGDAAGGIGIGQDRAPADHVPVIPDAPIGHFRLTLLGGKKGYLSNTKDLCHSPGSIQVEYTAQSGKRLKQAVQAQTPCGPTH